MRFIKQNCNEQITLNSNFCMIRMISSLGYTFDDSFAVVGALPNICLRKTILANSQK